MENYVICYVSTSRITKKEQVQEVLSYSEDWNNDHNLTGILLFSDKNFFQVIEGPKERVLSLFKNIQADNRHYALIPIINKVIPQGKFSTYKCRFISQESKYNTRDIDFYLKHIKRLDAQSQQAVTSILKAFIK